MDIHEVGTQFLEELECCGGVVHERAALGRRQDFAPQDEGVVVVGVVAFEDGFEAEAGDVECRLHHALTFLVGEHLRVCPLSEQQAQCPQQYRLARARLARHPHKTSVEGDVRLEYQGIVLNM